MTITDYIEYNNKTGDRKDLYQIVAETFNVNSAIYPGSHIDISPSLVIPKVTYIDNYKGAIKFFDNQKEISEYIDKNKQYVEKSIIMFYGKSYENQFDIEKVDLIISQFAGFVGQASKKYLKQGGILLSNDSHGDATLAFLDDDFEFIGIVNSENKIVRDELSKYFKFRRTRDIDKTKVLETMKGPKYKFCAANYLFRKK